MEQWKDIKGYEGLYQVSNLGRVKSLARTTNNGFCREDKMKATFISKGYSVVTLSKNGIEKHYAVHRLVAQAFIPNPDNLPEIDHIDTNRQNNYATNLQWVTRRTNLENPKTKEKRHKGVEQYSLSGEYLQTFVSIKKALMFCRKEHSGHISQCCRGKRNNAYGYIWKYAD